MSKGGSAKDNSAVLAKVGDALGMFATFLGAAPRAAEADASGSSGAAASGEEVAAAPAVAMTLQNMMLQLRRPPPPTFTIDHSNPLKGFEGLLTRAPIDNIEFIVYMQDGLRQETMLEQLDRFDATLEAGPPLARIDATVALVRALLPPHVLIEIEQDEYEDPHYAFPKTSSSSRIQVTKLFEAGRTAVIESGTWISPSGFSQSFRKIRKAMIKAASTVELKQQIAEHLPASTKIEECAVFKAVAAFRTAKEKSVAYLHSLALFEAEASQVAPAAAAAAAPALPSAEEPTEAAPYVMQNHTLVAHARKEADSCRASGITRYSTVHIDSQTAGLTTEALRPLALDRKAFRWTRLNCKSDNPAEAVGASVFMFCDNAATVDAAIAAIKNYQEKCKAIPRFGTPFMEIVNKMTTISYMNVTNAPLATDFTTLSRTDTSSSTETRCLRPAGDAVFHRAIEGKMPQQRRGRKAGASGTGAHSKASKRDGAAVAAARWRQRQARRAEQQGADEVFEDLGNARGWQQSRENHPVCPVAGQLSLSLKQRSLESVTVLQLPTFFTSS